MSAGNVWAQTTGPAPSTATVPTGTTAPATAAAPTTSTAPPAECEPVDGFWFWPVALFLVSFVLGVVAVLAGVGGGVLFVPVVGGFFPFHLDFVRCAGLMIALSGSVAAGPGLLRKGLANLRLAMPPALLASAGAIVGALIGLSIPDYILQIAMGCTILFIAAVMLLSKKSEYPQVPAADAWSSTMRICGIYREESSGTDVQWKIHRTPLGLAMFVFIGVVAGMFGLGAGWANVPVLNLVMGAPLKLSVATSKFLLSVTDSTAAWVYINSGATLPIIVVPSILGMMLGAPIGVRLLDRMKPSGIRGFVIALLVLAGSRALLKGLGVWK
jgi:uncharacterized membrane protein YfcA